MNFQGNNQDENDENEFPKHCNCGNNDNTNNNENQNLLPPPLMTQPQNIPELESYIKMLLLITVIKVINNSNLNININ